METNILIVEEDVSLAKFLKQELEAESFAIQTLHDGKEAFHTLQTQRGFNLLITELNLPEMDGVTLIQNVRPILPKLPILVLTARSSIEDKVKALGSGADDFLAKPFSFVELLARLRALLRRNTGMVPNFSRVDDLILYREERRVERNGRRIDLTPREFSIVEYMMRNAGKPVPRSTLFEEVWNAPYDPSTNIVDVYMKYVRDKVDLPGERKLTHTIRGIGYEFREAIDEAVSATNSGEN
jgi:two-component system copper resistance phosphate regulon response regulator CusR